MKYLIIAITALAPCFSQELLAPEQKAYREAALQRDMNITTTAKEAAIIMGRLEGHLVWSGARIDHASSQSICAVFGGTLVNFGRVDAENGTVSIRGSVTSTGQHNAFMAAGLGLAATSALGRGKNKEGWGLVGLLAGYVAQRKHQDAVYLERQTAHLIACLAAEYAATGKPWPNVPPGSIIEEVTGLRYVDEKPEGKAKYETVVGSGGKTLTDALHQGLLARANDCTMVAVYTDPRTGQLIVSYH